MVRIRHDASFDRIPKAPLAVPPVNTALDRPLWSVMIPVYNGVQYLPETIVSVLKQYPGRTKMQIEVIDDCSTDANVEELVKVLGKGLVRYYCQKENVGSVRNFQTCLERARGRWVHILHADDRVHTGFYSEFEKFFMQHPKAGAAFCRYSYINADGRWMYDQQEEQSEAGLLTNFMERIAERQRIQYVSMVVKREVYERLGGFYGVEYGEDWEMWARIAASYPVGYIPKILAEYRKHYSSISGRSFITGQNMRDLSWVLKQIKHHLPADKREKILARSRRFYAHYALKTANALWKHFRNGEGVKAQMKEAWKMHKDPLLLFKIFKLHLRLALQL